MGKTPLFLGVKTLFLSLYLILNRVSIRIRPMNLSRQEEKNALRLKYL